MVSPPGSACAPKRPGRPEIDEESAEISRALDDALRSDARDAIFDGALRIAFLASYLGISGCEEAEDPDPYTTARFEFRASRVEKTATPSALLRAILETTRDRVVYEPTGNLPRLLGSLSEPHATACAVLLLWAHDPLEASRKVSEVEGYACERAIADAARWARAARGTGTFRTL